MSIASLITGLAHVGIRVHDLGRSRAFYERLGFQFVAGPLGPEPVAVMRHPAGVEINFILNAATADAPNVLMDQPEKPAGYTHMSIAVTDVHAVKALLEKDGVAITEGPVTFDDGATAIFVRDPDRNVIEFNQAARSRA